MNLFGDLCDSDQQSDVYTSSYPHLYVYDIHYTRSIYRLVLNSGTNILSQGISIGATWITCMLWKVVKCYLNGVLEPHNNLNHVHPLRIDIATAIVNSGDQLSRV